MGIIKIACTVGFFTLLSRIAGFFRECVFAYCLGASVYSDALIIALKLSNTFRRIFAEGAFNASFLPRFTKIYTTKGLDEANKVLSYTFCFLLFALIIFSAFIIFFYPAVLTVMVHGFEPGSLKFNLALDLGRICFPYLIFISLTSLFAGVLNTINKFALASATYSVLSIFTATGMLIGYFLDCSKLVTVYITAVFVLFSGITQCMILYYGIKKYGFQIFITLKYWTNDVKDIVKNMILGALGAGVWQFNLLVDMWISSYLPVGTITCITLADRLNQFPLGTLGIAISTALLPILSRNLALKDFKKASSELKSGLLFVNFFVIFSVAIFLSLSEPIVAVAFQRGLFDSESVKITSDAVVGFCCGLPAYVLSKVFATLFFSKGDTKTPVIFGLISVCVNILAMILLIPFLKYFGIAFCTSIAAVVNTSLLIFFSRNILNVNYSKIFWYKTFSQIFSGSVSFFVLKQISYMFWKPEFGDFGYKWLIILAFIIFGIIVYVTSNVICLKCLNQKELKLWKKEVWSEN